MDLWKAPFPCLAHGLALTAFSLWLINALVKSNAAFWVFALILGFVFVASVTSVRSVAENFGAMLIWAALIVLLMATAVLTGLLGLIVIFPWRGLESWRAYRDLATEPAMR